MYTSFEIRVGGNSVLASYTGFPTQLLFAAFFPRLCGKARIRLVLYPFIELLAREKRWRD